jgi:secondary thiamine-phosphate synthase enzyme
VRIEQTVLTLSPKPRGVHLVTREIVAKIPELTSFEKGLAHLFLRHTSAALTVNENADPEVRRDAERFLDAWVPDGWPAFRHTLEGDDDMPAHIKSMALGCSLTLPIAEGRLALGTWQGIYLVEGRNAGGSRSMVVTMWGV